jgi:CRISPR-associated protein Csb1
MTTLAKQLESAQRLLVQASLTPVQGDRFQPTGFPDIGAATYTLADGTEMLLVESAQSMANRLEGVIWDAAARDVVAPLRGLPYIAAELPEGDQTTSIQEAHRLNSPYFLVSEEKVGPLEVMLKAETGYAPDRSVDRPGFARFLYRHDTDTLLHGVFMANIEGGRLRLPRALSSFVEARDVRVASSGGVKNDIIDPSGNTKNGFGNVPFHRTEFVAGSITAYFNLDLAQLRGYGLGDTAFELLVALGLYKIRLVLSSGMRLRTACDLMPGDLVVTAPAGFVVPQVSELEALLRDLVKRSATEKLFADPPVTRLAVSAKALKARKKSESSKKKEAAGETDGEQTADESQPL